MSGLSELLEVFLFSLDSAQCLAEPFRHWLLRDVFAADICRALVTLPFAPLPFGEMGGRRENRNDIRTFFSPANRRRFGVCRSLSALLQSRSAARRIEKTFGIGIEGSYLRIEYCQDTDGFWLEPHTDIAVKLLTMQVYLSDAPDAPGWGTDLYAGRDGPATSVPFAFNRGFAFVPSGDTWHGFRPRPISGVRRSVIVNYVTPEWRSRGELAYPHWPVTTRARCAFP